MSTTTEEQTVMGRTAVALSEATNPSGCGHKAATLAALLRAGCRVPDGFVIPVGVDCGDPSVLALLDRHGPGPWAVRSSGVAEDLDDASFAGQYETVLDVMAPDDVVAAAARVRASGAAAHIADYGRLHEGPADGAVAVLVQRMIQPTAAGIAFSANPVTGDDEVVIEAVPGLSEGLASGDLDGERWVESAGSVRPISDRGAIDARMAARIAALARDVARMRGGPQDIEWAIGDGELYLLQARPITSLPTRPAIDIPPGRWVKDTLHWTGPMSPVGASIVLPAIEASFAVVFAEFGFPLERIRPRSFGGEVYMQEIEVGGKHNAGTPPPWWAGAIAFRLVPSLRRVARTAEAAQSKLTEYPRAWEATWKRDCARRIEEARAVDLHRLSDRELRDHLDHLIDEVLSKGMLIHFQLMVPDMIALHDLAMCCEELLGWDAPKVLELLAGLSTTVTEPTEQLKEIAEMAGADVISQGLDAVRKSPAGPRLDEWLGLWGLRSLDMDPGAPTVAERESFVAGLLQSLPASNRTAETRRAAIERARERLDAHQRARFDRALATAQRIHPMREGNVLYTQSIPFGLVRRALLEIGRRLTAAGQLAAADDIVYLEIGEIRVALDEPLAGESARARVRRRRNERSWVRAHPGPAFHGPAPVPPPPVRGLPAALRRMLAAMVWEVALEDSPSAPAPSTDGRVLVGVGASGGRARGRVRVIRNEADLSKLEPGEILVCPSTHSTWAVVFARAAALVTDHGGMLAHPAIVAREHGIPAVVGTGTATSRLHDGDIVTVDGHTGRVELEAVAS